MHAPAVLRSLPSARSPSSERDDSRSGYRVRSVTKAATFTSLPGREDILLREASIGRPEKRCAVRLSSAPAAVSHDTCFSPSTRVGCLPRVLGGVRGQDPVEVPASDSLATEPEVHPHLHPKSGNALHL